MIKNNILDVLTFMFDFIFEKASNDNNVIDDITLKNHLVKAGFDNGKIDKAIDWLNNVSTAKSNNYLQTPSKGGCRVYSKEEKAKLNIKCQGFLMFMEDIGQLNTNQREMIIEQALNLGESNLTLEDLKWISMMVLSNDAYNIQSDLVENIVFADDNQTLQ